MISVCIPTYNGEIFLKAQLESILKQLGPNDEVIINDDCSTDNTIDIITHLQDNRIKLYQNLQNVNYIKNTELALVKSKGDIIFLADQDDIWIENKVEVMCNSLRKYDLVVSDCIVTDSSLNITAESYYKLRRTGRNKLLALLFGSPYLGCCLAFKKTVLEKALPFPDYICSHDTWIGNVSAFYFKVGFIKSKLIYYRRHDNNASVFAGQSKNSYYFRLKKRLNILRGLISIRKY